MRSTSNYLLVVLGFVLISSMLISAALDLSRVLPDLLAKSWEMKEPGAAGFEPAQEAPDSGELNFMRSFLIKERDVIPEQEEPVQAGLQTPAEAESQAEETTTWLPANETEGPSANQAEVDTILEIDKTENARPPKNSYDEEPDIPTRLVIPAIELDAPIDLAKTNTVKTGGKEYQQWKSPNRYAVGWHQTSALLGEPGNTVLNGHHNIYGKVFERLVDLNEGDIILVYGTKKIHVYQIANKMILPEKYQELDVRMDNARWIMASEDERLTLVTCWPETSNTHRLIIVARPLGS